MGAELRNLLGSAAALSERGHQVFYLNLSLDLLKKKFDSLNVEVREGHPVQITQINIPCIKHPNIFLARAKPDGISQFMFKTLKKLSPEVIISRPEYWPTASLLSRKLHTPLVLYLTDIRGFKFQSFIRYLHKYSECLHAPISVGYNILLCHLSYLTVVTSKSIEKKLRNLGIRRIVTLRPPYVRFLRVSKQLELKLPPLYVLVIITLSRQGNVEIDLFVLKLILAMANQLPNVPFIVVGTSRDELKSFREASTIPSNVKLIGKISDDYSLALLYKKASCVLCPILVPGLSTRLFEALFYAKPIITTPVVADYFGDIVNGKVCIVEENFSKWTCKIRELIINDRLRRMLSNNAKKYYNRNFSPEKHALYLERILLSIIERAKTQA